MVCNTSNCIDAAGRYAGEDSPRFNRKCGAELDAPVQVVATVVGFVSLPLGFFDLLVFLPDLHSSVQKLLRVR